MALHDADIELERRVLGVMLLSPQAVGTATRCAVRPDDFCSGRHRAVYAAIGDLVAQHQPVDVLAFGAVLRATGRLDPVGGLAALDVLTDAVPAVSDFGRDARTLRWLADVRREGPSSERSEG